MGCSRWGRLDRGVNRRWAAPRSRMRRAHDRTKRTRTGRTQTQARQDLAIRRSRPCRGRAPRVRGSRRTRRRTTRRRGRRRGEEGGGELHGDGVSSMPGDECESKCMRNGSFTAKSTLPTPTPTPPRHQRPKQPAAEGAADEIHCPWRKVTICRQQDRLECRTDICKANFCLCPSKFGYKPVSKLAILKYLLSLYLMLLIFDKMK